MPAMRVTIELHDALRRFLPGGAREAAVSVADGATVRDALVELGMDLDEPWNAALDGRLAAPADRLREGSRLIVFSPIAGG